MGLELLMKKTNSVIMEEKKDFTIASLCPENQNCRGNLPKILIYRINEFHLLVNKHIEATTGSNVSAEFEENRSIIIHK